MQISRDTRHQPPGVGTLMYVGTDEVASHSVDLLQVFMGGFVVHQAFMNRSLGPLARAALGAGGLALLWKNAIGRGG